MNYDVLIKGGTVVDGSGSIPAYQADLGLKAGRIVALGPELGQDASRIIDARGLVVTPGFIDPHTHYDAQLLWDSLASPSSSFGVTTVVIGNCGFALAPCKPQDRSSLMQTLVKVEGMSLRALEQGISWEFETFPQYLQSLQSHRPALNVAALAGHTPLRYYVMGEEANQRPANSQERQQIKHLFAEALEAGAFGLGTSTLALHMDENGQPVPSRLASQEEFEDLIEVFRHYNRGTLEITPGQAGAQDWMADFARRSGRPVTWAPLLASPANPERHRSILQKTTQLQQQGVQLYPQTGCFPLTMDFSLESAYLFESLPVWQRLFNTPRQDWPDIFRDTAFREAFRQELAERPLLFHGNWEFVEVLDPARPEHQSWRGMSIAALARQRGTDPLETLFDLSLDEDLKTRFSLALLNIDEAMVQELISHPSVLIATSDAGAHLTLLCDAGYTARMLGYWVRDKGALQLEKAVASLTSTPAKVYGIQERGLLKVGYWADVVVYDPTTITDSPKRLVYDLPGGEPRLVRDCQGLCYSLVNGQFVVEEGKVRAEAGGAGQVLRAGH
jgi:N-acyl-D-aspartate/D-glutamate deacylase